MNCCFINGSPKARAGNTEIFIREMKKGMKQDSEVFYAVSQDPKELANTLLQFDRIILVMPLYVFAMPGIVLELMEEMNELDYSGIEIGVIIQQGFDESKHSQHLKSFMERWILQRKATSLGVVVRGGSAAFCFMQENMYQKVAKKLQALGQSLESDGSFRTDIVEDFATPYQLGSVKCHVYQCATKLGLLNLFWNKMLKKHHAFEKRFDRPYL